MKPQQVKFRNYVWAHLYGKRLPDDWEFIDVDVILTPTSRLRRDVDNYNKAIFDALTNAKFWRDDSLVSSVSVQFTKPEKEPKTTLVFRQAAAKYQSFNNCLTAIGLSKQEFIDGQS